MFAAMATAMPTTSLAQELQWEVVDRFRLFSDTPPASRAAIEALLRALADGPEASRAEIYPSYGVLRSTLQQTPGLRTSNWNAETREYTERYLRPDAYRVRVRLDGTDDELCEWRADNRTISQNRPCGAWTELEIDAEQTSGEYRARVSISARTNRDYRVDETIVVEHDLFVALGDSFIAGEGNPDIPAVLPSTPPHSSFQHEKWGANPRLEDASVATPAQWWDEPCHRSLLSFPVTTTLYLASKAPHRATTLVHLACSGGEIDEGLVAPQNNLPGRDMNEATTQIAQLQRLLGPAAGRPLIRRVFLSVGGNDIGFGDVVQLLASPPNGYRNPLMPWIAGAIGTAVCPYEVEAPPLSRLCGGRDTAQARLEGLRGLRSLRQKYSDAEQVLRSELGVTGAMVVQTEYPDILRYRDADGALAFCRTGLNERDLRQIRNPETRAWERQYAEDYPGRVRAGFEALNGVVPRIARMRTRPYFFQLKFNPEAQLNPEPRFPNEVEAGCDMTPEPTDSEVCQAYWVWRSLNREVRANATFGWTIVGSHVAETAGHGWCVTKPGGSLALPLAIRQAGRWVWTPEFTAFDPYDPDLGRWFRTSNDSLLTQYAASDRFHQGTVHPTFRAHVAYAEAILREAFSAAPVEATSVQISDAR
tara:strand:- start:39230 stop:41173 length:1944 start_codon:yes stop_codon:yes gene_type:complete